LVNKRLHCASAC